MVPATQIIKPVFTWEPGVMWREGREYAITVQCDIIEGLQGATVTQELLPQLKALEAKWATSDSAMYRIEVAGAVEESSKGFELYLCRPTGHVVHHLHFIDAAVTKL